MSSALFCCSLVVFTLYFVPLLSNWIGCVRLFQITLLLCVPLFMAYPLVNYAAALGKVAFWAVLVAVRASLRCV